jgi:hypothetical protein
MGGIIGSFLAIALRHQGPQNQQLDTDEAAIIQEDEYLNL